MKRILITGSNSYIGSSLDKWLNRYHDTYLVETISLRDEIWKTKNFSKYDVIFHVAGIAHVSSAPNLEGQYYKVNRDLAIKTAEKAKNEGVKQFIFMSSIIVYGDSSKDKRIIDENTKPNPTNFYGKSKLQAEEGLLSLKGDNFSVVIVRPPMIYGKGSKGNYPKLAKAAQRLPVFPDISNERSMLHIDNLCEFIQLMIKNEESGIFFPQNSEYVQTSEMVKIIAETHGRNIKLVKVFNPIIKLLMGKVEVLNKVFGHFVYDKKLSQYKEDYRVHNFKETIRLSESRRNKK